LSLFVIGYCEKTDNEFQIDFHVFSENEGDVEGQGKIGCGILGNVCTAMVFTIASNTSLFMFHELQNENTRSLL
jgi:hypothetical protein